MKAILVQNDQSLKWDVVDDPIVGTDDVLIKVIAAGVNRADLMQRAGDYPPPPGNPEWMGLEVAGEIVQTGENASLYRHVGEKVCALLGGGGYAEYVSVRWDMCIRIPNNCSMIDAAAMPEAFCTAYLNLFMEGGLKKGQTLLMHAGASGLASVVIPMAKAFGARVITTVIQDEFIPKIKPLGADMIINTLNTDIADVLKNELENGHPIDLAIDCLGGEMMGRCLPYLQFRGRWIMIAALAGQMTEIDLKNVYVRNIRIIGSTLRSRTNNTKAEILHELEEKIWPMIENGTMRKPTIYRTFPMIEADCAHEMLKEGKSAGKIVLTV